MKTTARHTALQALLQMEENEGYSNIVIDKALRGAGWTPGTPACFCHFLRCLGTPAALDHFLRACLKDPKKKLDPHLWMILRCAAYQILYLTVCPTPQRSMRRWRKRKLSSKVPTLVGQRGAAESQSEERLSFSAGRE